MHVISWILDNLLSFKKNFEGGGAQNLSLPPGASYPRYALILLRKNLNHLQKKITHPPPKNLLQPDKKLNSLWIILFPCANLKPPWKISAPPPSKKNKNPNLQEKNLTPLKSFNHQNKSLNHREKASPPFTWKIINPSKKILIIPSENLQPQTLPSWYLNSWKISTPLEYLNLLMPMQMKKMYSPWKYRRPPPLEKFQFPWINTTRRNWSQTLAEKSQPLTKTSQPL